MLENDCGVRESMPMEISQRHIPLLKRLEREQSQLLQKLDDYDKAVAALKSNPEFQVLLDALGKVVNKL